MNTHTEVRGPAYYLSIAELDHAIDPGERALHAVRRAQDLVTYLGARCVFIEIRAVARACGESVRSTAMTREICKRCHRESAVGFNVPEPVWEAIAQGRWNILCIACFTEIGDTLRIAWDREITFWPVSLVTHEPRKLKSWESARVTKMLHDEIRDRRERQCGDPADITAMEAALEILYHNTEKPV